MISNRLTPDGTGDRLFAECAAETEITGRLAAVFEGAGYRKVRTPGLEFLSVFASSASYFPPEEMYKLSDSEGRLIAVRPDSTIPIARLVATKLKGAELPLRLYYSQSVYRRQPEHRGRDSEVTQMGVELIGEAGFAADVDMISLAVQSLKAVYGRGFRIEIGHVGLYKRLIERLGACGADGGAGGDAAYGAGGGANGDTDGAGQWAGFGATEELRTRIHRYVSAKNLSALEDSLVGAADRRTAGLILRLPGLFGDIGALDEAAELFEGYDDEITEMLSYLARVMKELEARGCAGFVMIDLGLVNQAEYYSSLVFKGYGESAGEPLLSGGRYDKLFCDFGEDLPATGFGMNIGLLAEAVLADNQVSGAGHGTASAEAHPLRIALAKGRLEEDFTALLEKAGYDIGPLRIKGRKLIIPVPGPGGEGGGAIEIFLAKAPDVVTCVEQGVCEIGVVGKDTLLEQGGTYYEILDLGLGKCRFALAAPSGGPVANGAAPQVVASKYPQYTGRYFGRLGLDVRIIRIEGSVEIAPLLGLADSIVDLVETGTTLRENGLDVVRWIRDISARLIVNTTGMKLRKKEVEALAARLAQAWR